MGIFYWKKNLYSLCWSKSLCQNCKCIVEFTKDNGWIYPTPSMSNIILSVYVITTIMLSSHLRLGIPREIFFSRCVDWNFTSAFINFCNISNLLVFYLYWITDNTWWLVNIIKLLYASMPFAKYKIFLTLRQFFDTVPRVIWLYRRSPLNEISTQLDRKRGPKIIE
jgi:hypothetical protein